MSGHRHDAADTQNECVIATADAQLHGFLEIPQDCRGIVVFAHGSGSSRFSTRNNAVAAFLREAGLGTLLFDLLTPAEERVDARTRELRFDIVLLARRLADTVTWLAGQPDAGGLPIGLFGSSTGAAAALIVATLLPERIAAVVSRGGRVDLAERFLDRVRAPALLIVGSRDVDVLQLNKAVLPRLGADAELAIVAGATHLFEEPGALQEVAQLARDWFTRFLGGESTAKVLSA